MLLKKGLFLASLLSMAPAAFAATTWPLTIENCGVKQTFTQAPQRVVTVGQHETELLLALGLEKPELVLAQYHWHIGPQGEVGTREQFASLGINTWISPADCTDKTVTETSNADGARSAPFSLAEITREVTDLATIFDVSARGEQLNRALAERIKKAQARASAKQLSVVFWFSSSRLNGDPWVAGNYGAPGWISRTLGLKNIIDSHDEWPAVPWEHIARSQPDVIVIAGMSRRLYPADEVEVKKAFLRSDPVTKNMPAVRNNHIIVVPAMSLNPSLRNVDAVELISDRLASFQDEQ